jgi:glycyl-tRNA synthetase beta subunit
VTDVLVGDVPAEFRSLPTEVLETVLVHHQKYVPLLRADRRRASPRSPTATAGTRTIVRNMGRVVSRACATARSSTRRTASARWRAASSDLEGVTFHRDLGRTWTRARGSRAGRTALAKDGLLTRRGRARRERPRGWPRSTSRR